MVGWLVYGVGVGVGVGGDGNLVIGKCVF